jgi:hypothetical protein
MAEIGGNGGPAIKVAVYAALTYDIISATNSSPQTTEINAAVRAETLMKWVKIGLLQAAGFAIIGVVLDKQRWPPALGSGLAGVLLWIQYVHAKNAGLATTDQPGTEQYGNIGPMAGSQFV